MKTTNDLPAKLAKPAQRALAGAGFTSLESLGKVTEQAIATLHGIGPNALVLLKEAMKAKGISFVRKQ